ncbi:MAG TPA: hypothetical protein VGV15_08960 [Terriglobales bacterium]|nr:hypothetical protein [Terriglobales bacterium]
MPVRHRVVICFFALVVACSFYGCGSIGHLPASTASLAKSVVGCPGGNMPCSGSLDVSQILVDGTDPATFGIPIACSVTAGSQTMKFVAVPSQPWFGVSPGDGTLAADATATIQVTAMNAANVNGRNIGVVTISASGYSDNRQMAVELNCNVAAGSCTVAFSCNPKTNPLP